MFKYIISFCFLIMGTLVHANRVFINGIHHNVQRAGSGGYFIDGNYHLVQKSGNGGYFIDGKFDSYIYDSTLKSFESDAPYLTGTYTYSEFWKKRHNDRYNR